MACGRTPGFTCGDQGTTKSDSGTRIPAASPIPRTIGTGDSTEEPKQKVLGACELVLTRTTPTEKCTIGELSLRGTRLCYTLEDVERDQKVYGETAIPATTYDVELSHSPKFKKTLPRLLNVLGFRGVLIHSGNTAADTEGCILVGTTKVPDSIGGSRIALKALIALLQPYQSAKASIRIRIVGSKEAKALKK